MSDKIQREKEEQYFLRKEMELREKLRQRTEEKARIARLKGEFGEADERVLKAFEEAGFSRETVVLLHILPLLEVAWADGSITDKEREQILEVARLREIVPGSTAFDMLEQYLRVRPELKVFDAARRAIHVIFESLPQDKRDEIKDSVTSICLQVAQASGGWLGVGDKVSGAERVALERVAKAFDEKRSRASGGDKG